MNQKQTFTLDDLKKAFKANWTPFSFHSSGDFETDFNKWYNEIFK